MSSPPKTGIMLNGCVQSVQRDKATAIADAACWPAPKRTDDRSGRQAGWLFGNPTLTDAVLLYHNQPIGPGIKTHMTVNPDFVERLVGLPENWTYIEDTHASKALDA